MNDNNMTEEKHLYFTSHSYCKHNIDELLLIVRFRYGFYDGITIGREELAYFEGLKDMIAWISYDGNPKTMGKDIQEMYEQIKKIIMAINNDKEIQLLSK